jgi:hypothetical protein
VLRHIGSAPRVNDRVNCVRLMGGLPISHAAWDADAVHGVHAMYSVRRLGTACGQRHPSSIFRGAFAVSRIAGGFYAARGKVQQAVSGPHVIVSVFIAL